MTTRITNAELAALVHRLNVATGSPVMYWKDANRTTAVGHYHLDSAYGGLCVMRTDNEAGGVTHALGMWGYVSKRECAAALRAAVALAEDAAYEASQRKAS